MPKHPSSRSGFSSGVGAMVVEERVDSGSSFENTRLQRTVLECSSLARLRRPLIERQDVDSRADSVPPAIEVATETAKVIEIEIAKNIVPPRPLSTFHFGRLGGMIDACTGVRRRPIISHASRDTAARAVHPGALKL